MPRAANQYNGSLIRPALCPNSNKAAVLNLEKLIEGRPSICADTVLLEYADTYKMDLLVKNHKVCLHKEGVL